MPSADVRGAVRVRTAGAGLDEHKRADEPGMRGGGEHGRVPAQRLADQDGPPQRQLIDNGDDVGDVGGAGDVPRVALAGAVPALVDRDDPIPGAQAPCQHVPFTRVTGQAVQQHNRLSRPAPVPAGKPDTVSHHHVFGPCHVGAPRESAGLDHAATASGRSTSRPRPKRAPARTRSTRWGAFTARHRCWADSANLKTIARAAVREPAPRVTLVRVGDGERSLPYEGEVSPSSRFCTRPVPRWSGS